MADPVLLYSTINDMTAARRIARALVEEKLAACVNLLPGMISLYAWEGAIEEDQETVMLVKTSTALADRTTARLRELHPYETPAIFTLPISGMDPDYRAWLMGQIASG